MYNYIIFIYLIGIFIIGMVAGKYVKGFDDYAIASGNFGFIILIGTIIATQWGGGSFLGIAGFGYEHLFRGVWYALSAVPRFLIWALFLSVIIRKVQPYTVSEWFALRYNKETGMLVSIINLVVGVGLLGSQFVAFGNVVNSFMKADLTTSIIIGALIVGIYTIAGGLFAVALTDVIQFVIAFAAALGVLCACILRVGTYSHLRQVLPSEYFNPVQPYGWFFMLTIFMLWMADLPCFLPLFLSPSCSNFLTVLRRNLKPSEEIKEKEASHGREKKEKAFK
jgi:SSS family solute:Na+ symporter